LGHYSEQWRKKSDLAGVAGPMSAPNACPVYGQQEQSAYNGHFESTCYHALLLFNREGDCLAAKLRPGNVHSADDWEELLLPEIERQQKLGKEVVFRADAAFAKPGDLRGAGRAGREVCHPHPGQ
jgi:Transposase DDE domain group 1